MTFTRRLQWFVPKIFEVQAMIWNTICCSFFLPIIAINHHCNSQKCQEYTMQLDEKISKNLAERKPRRLDKARPPGYTMDSSGRWFVITISPYCSTFYFSMLTARVAAGRSTCRWSKDYKKRNDYDIDYRFDRNQFQLILVHGSSPPFYRGVS